MIPTTSDYTALSRRLRDLEILMQPAYRCNCPGDRCYVAGQVARREFYDVTAAMEVFDRHRRAGTRIDPPNLAEMQAEYAAVAAERRAVYEVIKASRTCS